MVIVIILCILTEISWPLYGMFYARHCCIEVSENTLLVIQYRVCKFYRLKLNQLKSVLKVAVDCHCL